MFQRVSSESSIKDLFFEEIPTFKVRAVEDNGGNKAGGIAQVGKVGATRAIRSCTNCRA